MKQLGFEGAPPPLQPLAKPLPTKQDPAAVWLTSLAPLSRRTMRSCLRAAARDLGIDDPRTLPWHRLRWEHLDHLFRQWRDGGVAPATINARLAALRGVLRSARRLGLMDSDAHRLAVAGLRNLPRRSRSPARNLTRKELAALFAACRDDTPAGTRDAALLALLFGCGLRTRELAALQLEHVDTDIAQLTVREPGEGWEWDRRLRIPAEALAAVEDWLAVRGTHAGALLHGIRRGGRLDTSRGMSLQSIAARLKLRCRQAGIEHCSPHDVRSAHIAAALAAGSGIRTVAANTGLSPAAVPHHDRRGGIGRCSPAATVRVPYRRSNSSENLS